MKYLLLSILLFSTYNVFSFQNPPENNSSQYADFLYTSFSAYNKTSDGWFIKPFGGISVWYLSAQAPFQNINYPIIGGLEFGGNEKALSYMLFASFHAQFAQKDFNIYPLFVNLDLKYSLLNAFSMPSKTYDVFAMAGVSLNYSKFSDTGYSGIVGYELKIEKDYSPGANLGVGGSVSFFNISVSLVFEYSYANSTFYAGNFDKLKIATGYYDCSILLSYKFSHNPNKNLCPAYR